MWRVVKTAVTVTALAAVIGAGGGAAGDGWAGGAWGAAVTAAAGPSAYQQILGVYESQGTISPCRFSGPQLSAALRGVDTYGEQYFADFTQAVQAALSARAAGACPASPAPAPVRAPGGVPRPPAHFGPVTAATDAGMPAPLAVMSGLTAGIVVLGVAAVLWRRRSAR
jgi:hypothetical protein